VSGLDGGGTGCPDGSTCDGLYCVPAGVCTQRKGQVCDNAFYTITGNEAQKSKCCPPTSGCLKSELKFADNTLCSTTCGSCIGTIGGGGNTANYPMAQCSFASTTETEDIGFAKCYESITREECQLPYSIDPGSDKCSTQSSTAEASGCPNGNEVCCTGATPTLASCDPAFTVP